MSPPAAGPSRGTGRLMIVAAAVLFSTGGAAIKATSFGSWQVAGLRAGVACVFLLVVLPEARRRWTVRTWLVGTAYAATLVLFVLANKATTAGAATFLQATAPLYVFMLAPLLLRERVRARQLALMAVIAAGLALVVAGSGAPQETAPRPALGNALGAACGLAWALTLVGLRWMAPGGAGTRDAAAGALVAGNLLAFLACAPFVLPLGDPGPADWGVIGFLGVFQIGVAYLFLSRGLRAVPAFEASLLVLTEPVLNPVWTFLVHGERIGPAAIAGGALIMAAAVSDARLSAWRARTASG